MVTKFGRKVVVIFNCLPNFVFEADAVKRRTDACCVRTPRRSTQR
jgi:hypothetical protein